MAKAKEGRDAPETERPNPNRRTAMMITVGAAAISVASALPASASGSYAPSQGYLDCVAAWKREMVQGLGDDEGDRVMRENCKVVDRFLGYDGPITIERLGEIALVWRLNWWQDDDKIGDGSQSVKLERALWQAIEKLTGVKPQGGVDD